MKNVTITLPEELAHWARKQAAAENISVSRFVARMLEEQMRRTGDYWAAYAQWKKLDGLELDATRRLTRDEAHARR